MLMICGTQQLHFSGSKSKLCASLEVPEILRVP